MAKGKEYTFWWFIENYSYCFHDNGEELCSPSITPNGFRGTIWNLSLYPRGIDGNSRGKVSLYLRKCRYDCKFKLRYELSVITVDGSPLKIIVGESVFLSGQREGSACFLDIEEDLRRKKSGCLPQDTLRVRCKMWNAERDDIQIMEQIFVRTRIGVEKISFLHKVKNFSSLKPDEKKTIQIQPQSTAGCAISSSLYFIPGLFGEGIMIVENMASNSKYILRKQNISLLNESNNVIECGDIDNRFDDKRNDVQKLVLSLSRETILRKKSEYLVNDELCLLCECAFYTGIEFEKVVETQHELPVGTIKHYNKDGYDATVKLSACFTASEDMKAAYIDQCLTDVVLKTKTKTFPAHKVVLCARSSVFKAMLTNDMKEKNTDCIPVDDMENETVQQLLLFLYSDNVENLQWESAVKCYYAGDKYAIEKLKVLCSNFLVDNISISTASELLLVADTHNDSDLKNFVENFILKHKELIVDSDQWKNLVKTNPELGFETMYLMVKGKK